MFSNVVGQFRKILKSRTIEIDQFPFQILTNYTSCILFVCSMMITCKEYFGDSMMCKYENKKDPFMDKYCWTYGTYVYSIINGTLGVDHISYGINHNELNANKSYQMYYQWIPIVLLLQGCLFHLPARIWKGIERKRLITICQELDSPVMPDAEDYLLRKAKVIAYLQSNLRRDHKLYAYKYFACEVSIAIIIALNFIILNIVFPGFWQKYAPVIRTLFSNDWSKWGEYTAAVFPLIAKCDFYPYGPSGSIQMWDVLCLLPLNVLNEKMFAFIYIWFVICWVLAMAMLIYRFIFCYFMKFRLYVIKCHGNFMLTDKHIMAALNDAQIGDWFIYYLLARSLNPIVFYDIMIDLVEFKNPRSNKSEDSISINMDDSDQQ